MFEYLEGKLITTGKALKSYHIGKYLLCKGDFSISNNKFYDNLVGQEIKLFGYRENDFFHPVEGKISKQLHCFILREKGNLLD